jgi:polyhydroxyalkanoate synthesis regulator phasin
MGKIAKILLSSILAVTMVVGTTGMALADDGQSSQPKPGGLLDRVAQILNIDAQKLKDAFKQALTELRTERQNTGLQNLVDGGKLTQEQADQLKAWLDSRPDVPRVGPNGLDQLLKDGKITQQQYDAYQTWLKSKPDVPLPKLGEQRLENGFQKLVENGKLTQEQADQLKAWLDSRPADVPMVGPQMMDQLLKDGKITQQQYDAFQTWMKSKPDVPIPEPGPGTFGPRRGMPWRGFQQGTQPSQPEASPTTY